MRPSILIVMLAAGWFDHVSHADWTMVDVMTAGLSAWGIARVARVTRHPMAWLAALAFAASAVAEVACTRVVDWHTAIMVSHAFSVIAVIANLAAMRATVVAMRADNLSLFAVVLLAMFVLAVGLYLLALGGNEPSGFFAGLLYLIGVLVYPSFLIAATTTFEARDRPLPRAALVE